MQEIKNASFDPSQYSLAVVDCWAEWCMPCKMLMPAIENLSKEMQNVNFFKANIEDNNSDLLSKHGISSIPAILIFKNGNLVEKMIGLVSQDKIKQSIERASC